MGLNKLVHAVVSQLSPLPVNGTTGSAFGDALYVSHPAVGNFPVLLFPIFYHATFAVYHFIVGYWLKKKYRKSIHQRFNPTKWWAEAIALSFIGIDLVALDGYRDVIVWLLVVAGTAFVAATGSRLEALLSCHHNCSDIPMTQQPTSNQSAELQGLVDDGVQIKKDKRKKKAKQMYKFEVVWDAMCWHFFAVVLVAAVFITIGSLGFPSTPNWLSGIYFAVVLCYTLSSLLFVFCAATCTNSPNYRDLTFFQNESNSIQLNTWVPLAMTLVLYIEVAKYTN